MSSCVAGYVCVGVRSAGDATVSWSETQTAAKFNPLQTEDCNTESKKENKAKEKFIAIVVSDCWTTGGLAEKECGNTVPDLTVSPAQSCHCLRWSGQIING